MYLTQEVGTCCPYCGESISIVVDLSGAADGLTESFAELAHSSFIEDCEVCCRPIEFTATGNAQGTIELLAQHENDT